MNSARSGLQPNDRVGAPAGKRPYPRAKRLVPSPSTHVSENTQTQTEQSSSERTNLTFLSEDVGTLLEMSSARDAILTEYVRKRIREWEAAGRNLQDIEVQNGVRYMSKSYTTRIKLGMNGVSAKTAPGFARAFGFANALELQMEAHRWARNEGREALEKFADPSLESDPNKKQALEFAKKMNVDDLAIKEALEKHPNVRDESTIWWLNEFERAQTKIREQAAKDARAARVEKSRRRKLAEARKRAPESSSSLPGDEPSSEPSERTLPKKKISNE